MLKHLYRSVAVFIVAWLGLTPTLPPARADSWRVTVHGGDTGLGETPLVAQLKVQLPVGSYLLEPATGGDAFPAQVFDDGGTRLLGTVLPRIAASDNITFTIKSPPPGDTATASGLSFEPQRRNLKVMLGQQLLTEYRVDAGNKPFFYPLVGPSGESYTRIYPLSILPDEDHDHPHQRSCWFTYGNVNGLDFWSEGNRFGTIRETARKLVVAGPVVGRLQTTNEWRSTDDQRICSDERTVTFYRTKTSRVLDFAFRILATDGPVTFRDTKEGMFGVRVASSMDVTRKAGGKITNAEGWTDENAWGKASSWVDYVGPVKGKTVGIAIINHPDSFRFPTTWHVRTYGLFAANPFGWHDFGRSEKGDYTIKSGQTVEFFYRLVLHEGDTKSANVLALFAAYAKPPTIEVQKD